MSGMKLSGIKLLDSTFSRLQKLQNKSKYPNWFPENKAEPEKVYPSMMIPQLQVKLAYKKAQLRLISIKQNPNQV